MRGYLNKRVTEKIFIENKLSSFSFHKSSKGPFQNLLGAMSSFLMESSLAVLTSERTSKSISSDWFSACNFRLAEEAWTNACPHSGGIKRKLWRHAQQEIVLKLPARLRQVPKVSAKVVGAWSPAPSRGRQPQIGAHPPPRREALSLFYSGWRRGLCPPDREGANRAHLAPVFRRKTERTPPPPTCACSVRPGGRRCRCSTTCVLNLRALCCEEMGAAVTRAVRNFNLENRAEREISKLKPSPAPRHPSTKTLLREQINSKWCMGASGCGSGAPCAGWTQPDLGPADWGACFIRSHSGQPSAEKWSRQAGDIETGSLRSWRSPRLHLLRVLEVLTCPRRWPRSRQLLSLILTVSIQGIKIRRDCVQGNFSLDVFTERWTPSST